MRIQRVRPAWTEAQLHEIYATPHDHTIYGMGHHLRVEATKMLGFIYSRALGWPVVADLSCGNGEIARSITDNVILGDFAPGYAITGPVETTIPQLQHVDCYILSETLEHLDDPQAVLKMIRGKSRCLLLSTPIEAWDDSNGEHYWAWDREGVESLLAEAHWTPTVFASLDSRVFGEPYYYGMWVCQ